VSIFKLALLMPLILTGCIIIPVGVPDEKPFAEEKLDFLESSDLTSEQVYQIFSDYPVVTDDGEFRLHLKPIKFNNDSWWLYVLDWQSWEWLVITYAPSVETQYYQFLLLKFDEDGYLLDYQTSISETDFIWGGDLIGARGSCNEAGICKWGDHYMLFAPEDEDEKAKSFDKAYADTCAVYAINSIDSYVRLAVDDLPVAPLIYELYAFWQVVPGKHTIKRVGFDSNGVYRQVLGEDALSFVCIAGEEIFIRYDRSFFLLQHYMEQLSADEGRSKIANRHRVMME
jgi:hypothetical protein